MKISEAIEILSNESIKEYFRENNSEEVADAISTLVVASTELQRYKNLGTIDECRVAIGKQKAKKVRNTHKGPICPCCGYEFPNGWEIGSYSKVCPECGQKMLWKQN